MPNWTYHTIDENDVSNLRALIGEEQRMLWKEQISCITICYIFYLALFSRAFYIL